jgi:predicted ATPase
LELCRHLGEPAQRFPVLGGLWQFYACRAEYQKAYELAEEFLTLAQYAQDPALLLGAHDVLGQTYYFLGEFVRAREHFEHGLALSDLQSLRSLALLVGGEDPGLACRGFAAFISCHLGFPDRALQRMHEAFGLAQELHSPFNQAWTLVVAAQLHQCRREAKMAQKRAEELIALSTGHGFAGFLAMGTLLRGWALAAQGQAEEGLAQIRQGWAAYRATGAEQIRPYFLALLAEVYGKMGQIEEGLTVLAKALAFADKTGMRVSEADLYRLKGELTLQSQGQGPQSQVEQEAEECFLKAIEVARRQSAKSLELRAVMSLARLWQQQGKKDEARLLLMEIYNWFTEGFDTKDLQEAKALLEALT